MPDPRDVPYARLWAEAKADTARDAVADSNPGAQIEPGCRLVQIHGRAPRVPMLVERNGSEYRVLLAGQEIPLWRALNAKGERIDRSRYDFLMAEIAWARTNDPGDPRLRPFEPVDVSTLDPMEP